MASITMNAQYEGLKLWDKDVVRYLNSDHVPVYQPIEEFLYDLPRWDGKDHIGDLAKRVPCNNPHWAQLFRRWFLSMIAHWRGLGKNHANSTSPSRSAGLQEIYVLPPDSTAVFAGVLYG